MEDKDILVSHIEASKETVDSKIGDKETQIIKDLTDDWKQTDFRIIEEQHHRNRTVVEEIIKTWEDFREDISNSSFPLILLSSEGIQETQRRRRLTLLLIPFLN